jgi:hypothetical protein
MKKLNDIHFEKSEKKMYAEGDAISRALFLTNKKGTQKSCHFPCTFLLLIVLLRIKGVKLTTLK